jgi:methylase of polypeptide subunit release factors
MTTLLELKSLVRDVLADSGVDPDEAAAEAEIISRHVTGLNPTEQVVFESAVPEQWLADVELIIRRRLEHVPIQYILGEAYFYGLKIYAIEISDVASKVAKSNAQRHQVVSQIEFLQGDWRKSLPFDLNLIVSNPPYIPRHKAKELLPEVIDNEPHLALFGGDRDGLGHYRDFARLLGSHLAADGGHVCMEVGDDQAPSVARIFEQREWSNVKIEKDLNGRERVVSAWSPKNLDVKKT